MKKIYFPLLLLAALLVIAGCTAPNNQVEQPQVEVQESQLVIDGQAYPVNNEYISNTTVYDLLLAITAGNQIQLETKQYDFGILVEAIGDKTNGQGDKYWLYYVNGEMPMVSVDNYQLNPGDTVEFKFEESQF